MSIIEVNPDLRDAEARAAIATSLDRNVMVMAGAGAGKTHELVGRMIALVASGEVQVEHIAAITFTRKAAGELRERFIRRLNEVLPSAGPEAADHLKTALRNADQCFMGTIHSFCGRLLRERPVEGQVPPDFAEVEAEDETRLSREFWDRFVSERYAAEDDRLLYLEQAGIVAEDLFEFFRERSTVPELELKKEQVARPDLIGPAKEVVSFFEEVAGRIPPFLPKGKDEMMRAIDRVLHGARNRGIEHQSDAAAILELCKPSLKVTLNRWEPENDFSKQLRDELYPEFHARVVEPALRQWREHLYPYAADFVDDAVIAYAHHRRDVGKLTFEDLLQFAERMLRDSPEVRAYFRERYHHVLVDEFQDTDPIQAQILLYLTGANLEEKDWRKLEPRPGSLFLVGDEKQSIYRFRRADVDTFRFMRDRIAATGGLILDLNTSFRSLGNLCNWINASYPSVFSAHDPRYQTNYGELYRYRHDGDDPVCVRSIRIPKFYKNNNDEITAYEAERIAAFIRAALDGRTPYNGSGEGALLDERAKPSDFLILTRYTKQLKVYAAALERLGIPYDVTGSKGLKDSEEVRAVVDFLRVVHEPDNPVFYVSFLRGLLVGLSDRDLYLYHRDGGVFLPERDLPGDVTPDLRERVQQARSLVQWATKKFQQLTPSAALELVLERTGLVAFARSRPLGSSRAGNLLRLVSLVRSLEDRGLHWGQIVTELQALVDGGAYELQEMTLSFGSDDAVRIMNTHQAKGLQARVVFLADPCGSGSKKGPDRHVNRLSEPPYLSMLIQRSEGDYGTRVLAQPVGWEEDAEEEKRHCDAEDARLLYVAGTRARNMLIVGMYPEKMDAGNHYPLYPALLEAPELESFASGTSESEELSASMVGSLSGLVTPGGDGMSQEEPAGSRPPDRRAQVAAAAKATYRRSTVTGEKEAPPTLEDGVPGKGRDFGSIVHIVFEDAILDRLPGDPKPYVRSLCAAADLDEQAASDILAMLRSFRSSELWQEIESADEVYTEVPVGILEEEPGDVPVLVRGKIDLIYRRGSSWTIVDFKTDVDASTGQLPLELSHYARQVQRYAAYWQQVADQPVGGVALYGTKGSGGLVRIDMKG